MDWIVKVGVRLHSGGGSFPAARMDLGCEKHGFQETK